MKLAYPLKDIFITQYFGENPEYYHDNFGITAHNGIDFRAPHGTPVYASHDGFAYYEKDSSGGCGVVIRSTDNTFKTIYWHLVDSDKEPDLKSPITCTDLSSQGQEIKTGDLIGYADNTGKSAGSHLHLGCKPIAKNEQLGTYYNPMQNNGYMGAIDPMPYLPPKFKFNFNMQYGDRTENVKKLQQRLIDMAYTIPSGATGFYGKETQAAVYRFQMLNVPNLSIAERYIYKGKYCGEKTRIVLNQR